MTWSRVNGDNVTHDGPEKGTWCQIGAKFNNVFEDGMCRCIVTAVTCHTRGGRHPRTASKRHYQRKLEFCHPVCLLHCSPA